MAKANNNYIKISRRRFLQYAASAPLLNSSTPPLMALFATILNGQCQKAYAEVQGFKPRNLIRILEYGAPARSMYDSFLTPYSSTGFLRNNLIGTQFKNVNGRYIGLDYVTYPLKGIQVPTMWTHDLPNASGGYRPMSELLDNLLCIQGIDTRNGGHTASAAWAWEPPGAKQSINALSADASNAPFATLDMTDQSSSFRSIANKSALVVSMSGNLISNVLSPFQKGGSSAFKDNKASIVAAFQGILPKLDELALNGHEGAAAIINNREAAFSLAETNFTNLTSQWTALVTKYQSLVSRAIYDPSKPLIGINDRPIGHGGTGPELLYQVNQAEDNLDLHLAADVRDAVVPTTNVNQLAEKFALTEYAILNNLTSSIAITIYGIDNFKRSSDGVIGSGMVNDQHFTGLYPHFYFNVLRHRAVAACILELISQLKIANKFKDTVIINSGEFNRIPRNDETGSDHGQNGLSQAIYCGAISGPLVIGNIANELGTDYFGTWGQGATIPELGRQLTLADSIITVAHLIGVPAPLTSASPLVTLGSNGIVSNIGTTRIVA